MNNFLGFRGTNHFFGCATIAVSLPQSCKWFPQIEHTPHRTRHIHATATAAANELKKQYLNEITIILNRLARILFVRFWIDKHRQQQQQLYHTQFTWTQICQQCNSLTSHECATNCVVKCNFEIERERKKIKQNCSPSKFRSVYLISFSWFVNQLIWFSTHAAYSQSHLHLRTLEFVSNQNEREKIV